MILYSAWLRLPITTRHEIARVFKIPKTGATEVVSNEIVRDGYNVHDLEAALTKEALQQFLGSTQENYQYLWEDTIARIEGREPVTRATTYATEEEPISSDEAITVEGGQILPGAVFQVEDPPTEPLPTVEEQIQQKTRRVRKPRHGKKQEN